MLNGKRLEKFEDFQECRLFNHRIEIEELDTENVIDSGIIQRLEESDLVIVNGTPYKMDNYSFFYRPFPEE